jgi:hypothetical protein
VGEFKLISDCLPGGNQPQTIEKLAAGNLDGNMKLD